MVYDADGLRRQWDNADETQTDSFRYKARGEALNTSGTVASE